MMQMSCIVEIVREWANESGEALIRSWRIDKVSAIRISGDTKSLQDTCSIRLPKNVKWMGGYEKIPIKRGDYVKVWLGYDGRMEMRFCGYVKDVSAKTPTTLTVIDSMYVLQHTSAKMKSYRNATLNMILADQLPKEIRWRSMEDVAIGLYRVTARTVAGVLQDLKQNYGIESTFVIENESPLMLSYVTYRGGRRMAGVLESGRNVIGDDLSYRRRGDIAVKVYGVSILANGSRIEYNEGEGEVHQIYRYGLSQGQLVEAVREEIERLKWEGLSGTVTTFGAPRIDKLDMVEMRMEQVERGRYQVNGVNITFDNGGYRQIVQLGRLISE